MQHQTLSKIVDIAINAFQEKDLINKKNQFAENVTRNMLLWIIQFCEDIDEELLYSKKGKDPEIKLKEMEIEFKTMLTEPDMYHFGNWREIWQLQESLRDKEWLVTTLAEEKFDQLDQGKLQAIEFKDKAITSANVMCREAQVGKIVIRVTLNKQSGVYLVEIKNGRSTPEFLGKEGYYTITDYSFRDIEEMSVKYATPYILDEHLK